MVIIMYTFAIISHHYIYYFWEWHWPITWEVHESSPYRTEIPVWSYGRGHWKPLIFPYARRTSDTNAICNSWIFIECVVTKYSATGTMVNVLASCRQTLRGMFYINKCFILEGIDCSLDRLCKQVWQKTSICNVYQKKRNFLFLFFFSKSDIKAVPVQH